jgi:UDP-N-acetylmuramoyl-L-alanyl-D-glutamate--2,6-diaminopimelate ligase
MWLGTLMEGLDIKKGSNIEETEVNGISSDSRRIGPGDLFVALRGGHVDGRRYIHEALSRGAAAVVYDGEVMEETGRAPVIHVQDARGALALMASRLHGNPSDYMTVVGVTGTNGKTTTARLIKAILEASGRPTGLIGTINYVVGDRVMPAPFTTPEPPEFQALLEEMLKAGCTHVVSEVSSHALSQKRVDHTRFGLAVFTNLTRDHLDFHGTMEEYFRAKKRLFAEFSPGRAVLNVDDHYGCRLREVVRERPVTFGTSPEADLRATEISVTPAGLSLTIVHEGRHYQLKSPLSGRFNGMNILAAAGAAVAMNISWDVIRRGVGGVVQVEGRFERVELGQDFLCVVDYAHTEDALRRLVQAARELTRGRVITVFGCGGDRDQGKRPAMGSAATALSDLVLITSDNPRGEDPGNIIAEIESGIRKRNYRVVQDRAEAIREAVGEARAGDTVLIAGKGHEDYQEVSGIRHHFSDRQEARRAIAERLGGTCA